MTFRTVAVTAATKRRLDDDGAGRRRRSIGYRTTRATGCRGDRGAWERLVDQYGRLIWAITRDFKLVESDAADVAQVTWLRLLENVHKIEHPDRVGSWLAATARNECLRSLAARKKVVLADDNVVLEGAATPEPEIDERLLWPSGLRWFAKPFRACPGGGSRCSSFSWPIRPLPTPRYLTSSDFPLAVSAPPVAAAWPSSGCCCLLPNLAPGSVRSLCLPGVLAAPGGVRASRWAYSRCFERLR